MKERFLKKNLPRPAWWALAALVVLARLALAWCQRVQLMTDSSPLDDMLMIRAAQSIVEGNWLGAYSAFAIAKNMGYALWLALLHLLHIPVLVGQAALWVGASAFAVRALRPLLAGNLPRLLLLAFLAFNPVAYASFTMRVYRDAIFPAFCLLLFAGAVGLALRLPQKRAWGGLGMALGAGAGLAGCWLLREDGLLLLVFAAAAMVFVALFAVFYKGTVLRAAKALLALVPFGVLLAGALAFSALNNAHYGVFRVNDLNGGAFAQAYGAMVGVSRGVSGFSDVVPVTAEALERLYQEVPALAGLEQDLAAGPAFNGFASRETGEYGGSFYFGLRVAADNAGKTPTGAAAQEFWQTVADEIAAAVEQGRLPSEGTAASVIPRYDSAYLGATLRETLYGGLALLTLEDCDPRPTWSTGPDEDVAAVAAFLNERVQTGYAAGTDQPYYNVLQRLAFAACDLWTPLYAVALWGLLAVALVRMVRGLWGGVAALCRRRGLGLPLLLSILALGLLCSFLLRIGVAAYMEVASFRIGTYIMYLASGMPALVLFGALGFALPLPELKKTTPGRLAPFARINGKKDLRIGWVIGLALALVAIKLFLAGAQQVYLDVNRAPLDDGLAIQQAMSISEGNWLGAYDWKTLSKHSFFSLWLSGLHAVGIPFLLGGNLLWALASGVGALALAPVLKRRWLTLGLFAALLFNPASLANPAPYGYITRVYRDNIFPSLCVLAIAGLVGFTLRWQGRLPRLLPWLICSGLGFAAAWLTREDGWWLLPFMAAATAVAFIFILQGTEPIGRRIAKCAAALLPFVLLCGALAGWAALNLRHYGVFVVSDFSSGSFAAAYGAMTRIEHEEWDPKVAVPRDVRAKLYAAVPEFAELEMYLETAYYMDRYAGEEYSSGSFYWALREAVWEAGHCGTAAEADAYYSRLAKAINALIDDGTLVADRGRRVSVNPPIRAEYIPPVLGQTLQNLWYTATFQDCDPRSLLSLNDTEVNPPVEAYLRESALVSAVEGTDQPYHSRSRQARYRVLDILNGVYTVAVPLALLLALGIQIIGAWRMARRMRKKSHRDSFETMAWFVGLGLLASIGLRAAMIAYVDVSSFNIGIYIMYLATIHPLMILYSFGGSVLLVRWLRGLVCAGDGPAETPAPMEVQPQEDVVAPAPAPAAGGAGKEKPGPQKAGREKAPAVKKEKPAKKAKSRKRRDGKVVYKPGGEL